MTDDPLGRAPSARVPPRYTRYRTRPQFRKAGGLDSGQQLLDDLRPGAGGRSPRAAGAPRPSPGRPPRRPGDPARPGRRRKPITFRRVVRWTVLGLVGWVALSLVLFLISAQVQSGSVKTGGELSGGGPMPFSANTILVLGSDARPKNTKEPGGVASGGRADSIMLLRVGGGSSSSLSIPRDTIVDIPGYGRSKINAAYAYGGVPLTIKTVKQYLGITINHVMLVSFTNFPDLIDAMGGVDYTGGCVKAKINGGYKNGGVTLNLKKGTTHLDGARALALSRVRHNACKPDEDDFARQARQQALISGMKSQVLSPEGFVRLPLISWNIPKALQTDMGGPTLVGLFSSLALFGTPTPTTFPESRVTETVLPDGGDGLTIPDDVRREMVRTFEDG